MITPVYNTLPYLGTWIASLLEQTDTPALLRIEVIAVDGDGPFVLEAYFRARRISVLASRSPSGTPVLAGTGTWSTTASVIALRVRRALRAAPGSRSR